MQLGVSLYVTNVAYVCVQSSHSIMTFKVNLSSHVKKIIQKLWFNFLL